MGKIQEKYDLVEKKSDFEIFYEEKMIDFELGAYDILFCPEKQNWKLYAYAVFVKCIEFMLYFYVWLVVGHKIYKVYPCMDASMVDDECFIGDDMCRDDDCSKFYPAYNNRTNNNGTLGL